MKRKVIVIIAAAGLAERMKSQKNKAFLNIAGKSMISRTVETFLNCRLFSELIVMVNPEEEELMREELAHFASGNTRISIVEGGQSRQESVRRGLEFWHQENADQDASKWICLVHDAARCLVSERVIEESLDLIAATGCAVGVAVPVTDTLHLIDQDMNVLDTPPRKYMYAAQTPQGAYFDQLYMAHKKAERENFSATDDISVLRHAGFTVKICPGESSNIKITHPEDRLIAQKLLENRKP